ncbi:serine protease inhibitor ecotin [Niabella pedocola]|uniref:Serine protease inhibitor ecotin n=1 Tax=Niabella pedocola TaxID=1752077 RepID=A0ABS8PMB5_9BACT|nr:serine protease inhibitor ecotin [Niabella pedocola]MCD2422005.1 serine protease inhibitor ecotin [Niabella pedocola]
MMKKFQLAGFLFFAMALISCSTTKKTANTVERNEAAQKQLEHFPKEKKGYKRYVILLSEKGASESDLKLELIPGKVLPTDCNTRSLNGKIVEKDVQGWGYTYYEFSSNGTVVSTMMACPDGKKTEKFVGAKPEQLRYNSKLPVVVFVPDGYELKYRIWNAGNTADAAVK